MIKMVDNSQTSGSFTIQPPDQFDFTNPLKWEIWIRRFERFRIASGLHRTSSENQVNTLMYCMGEKSDDILQSLNLSEEEQDNYDAIKGGFQRFFIRKKNVIYERAVFNRRIQEKGESVDDFITALHKQADRCNYRDLKEELIRDRIVVGIANIKLSEKMQLDGGLTLETATDMAKVAETRKEQQASLRGEEATGLDMLSVDRISQDKGMQGNKTNYRRYHKGNSPRKCQNCGNNQCLSNSQCPARFVNCFSCKRRGHFRRMCTMRTVHEIQEDPSDNMLLSISAGDDPWTVDLKLNGRWVTFKIDTGADVTVLPDHIFADIFGNDTHILRRANKNIFGPGHAPLEVKGVLDATLQKGEKWTQETIYVVNKLETALLGRRACTSMELVCRIDSVTSETIESQYPGLCSGLGKMEKPYIIELEPEAKPFSLKTPRRIPIPLLPKVKEELQRMEQLGVISRINEPTEWCAGMVVVPKKSGDLRICVDLTQLNKSVRREKFIIPSVEETLGLLSGAKIFSKLDANMGFWQIPLDEETAKLTTFITPFGRFYFKRLPFGIASAPEHFQNRMTIEVTEGLTGTVSHIDDVLVWGCNQEEHDARLHAVLRKMEEAGITLNVDKCKFSQREVKFLGHIISDEGIRADPGKTAAISDMKTPTNIHELRSFLGMVNQLGKFIPQLAERTKPLRDLLSKKNHWYWGEEQKKAFHAMKDGLTSTPALALYDPNRETKISADASSFGLGAVLLQKWVDEWKPVAYASRALSPVEQRYAQVEKEALALTWACERFRIFVIGRHFLLETDHKPLVSLFGSQTLDALPPRIQRLRMRLMRYTYSIQHIAGKNLITADTLSRAPLTDFRVEDKQLLDDTNIYVDQVTASIPASATFLERLRRELLTDSESAKVMQMCLEGWPENNACTGNLRVYWTERALLTVHKGLLLKGNRLVIPETMRKEVIGRLHEGHQGIGKCRERARQSVWWPGLSKQLSEAVQNCRICIKERSNHAEPLMQTELPDRPWQRLGADIFTLRMKKYLVVVDYYSRFIEVANLTLTKSVDVTIHLKSIFARHGVPEILVTDNGPQFACNTFATFASDYGFQHVTSSPGYPQGNGEAERAVQTVKNMLTKSEDPFRALLAYRSTPLQNGFSPAQLLMGRRLRTTVPTFPSQLDPAIPDRNTLRLREGKRKCADRMNYNRRHRTSNLKSLPPGKQVWVTDARVTGTVTNEVAARSYVVKVPNGSIRRNRRHLIPINIQENTQAHTPTNIPDQKPIPYYPEGTPRTPRTRSGRPVRKPKKLDY